jgi:uncharacterized iron-regulated membrane protein
MGLLMQSRVGPGYRTVWRWHFYAGLFCVPFVLWLSVTGAIYLFKPQIEAWLDRPYEALLKPGQTPTTPEAQVKAAIAVVPGSGLSYYELPRTRGAAAQIVVGKGADEYRVYVHPATAQVLYGVDDRARPFPRIFYLHGELLAGDKGSMLIELAGSWTIVMILTGLVLWWPRDGTRLGGLLYPRLKLTGRLWWRDVHSVTGAWASFFVLALLITGLPWAKSWGSYLMKVRSIAAGITAAPDWPTGSSSERKTTAAKNAAQAAVVFGNSEHHHGDAPPARFGGTGTSAPSAQDGYLAINTILPAAERLPLAYPVQIVPPTRRGGSWFVRSDSQNRMLRDTYTLDPASGAVLHREGFAEQPWIDRIVNLGVSWHEGQLFGILNQVVGLFTAFGAATLAISSVVMWWRRRPVGVLGAPVSLGSPSFGPALVALVVLLALAFPTMGVSAVCLLLAERLVLRRVPAVRHWLGLQPA